MIVIVIGAGFILLTGIALSFYWLHAPILHEPALASKISRERITFDGYERTYWRYVPSRLSHPFNFKPRNFKEFSHQRISN